MRGITLTVSVLVSVLVLVLVACGGDDDGGVPAPAHVVSVSVQVYDDGLVDRLTYGDGVTPVVDAFMCRNIVRIAFDGPLDRDSFEDVACQDGTFARAVAGCGEIGVLDEDEDGEPDVRQLSAGVVSVACGAAVLPFVPDSSFYHSERDELELFFSELPVAQACGIEFGQALVDVNANQPCAPEAGQTECSNGNPAAIGFATDCARIVSTSIEDGATDVPVDGSIAVGLNVPSLDMLDMSLTESFALADASGELPFTISIAEDDAKVIALSAKLTAATTYTLTLPMGCGDDALQTIEFTTTSR